MYTREQIKEEFVQTAMRYGLVGDAGDSQKSNKALKNLHALYNEVKEQNQIDVFREFLNAPNENVRLWAATFTLKMFPELAIDTLEKLGRLKTITGLSAQTTLILWREGKLELL